MFFIFSKLLDVLFPRSITIEEIEKLFAMQLRTQAQAPAKMRLPALHNIPVAATAVLHYRQPLIQQAVWELKYRGNQKIARLFAELAQEEIEKIRQHTSKEIILIPLPSSPKRRRERGWNQTELIAAHIKNATIHTHILQKTRHTTPQAKLKNRQRLTNLSNSFALTKNFRTHLPADPLIILFDDVTTTGATFAEALQPFFQAGLTDIYCLAIAH